MLSWVVSVVVVIFLGFGVLSIVVSVCRIMMWCLFGFGCGCEGVVWFFVMVWFCG